MSEQNAVVAVYGTHTEAEEAVKELQRAGIDMHTLSIVGKDTTPMNTWWVTTIPATG
jgi:precorrin-3B methylase